MSDDDRDIDIESDVENDSDSRSHMRNSVGGGYYSQAEKRAHHNALERKRRDHIKDSFTSLRDSVPALQGEKVASRAQILKKAAEYIQFMRRKNNSHQQDIEDLRRQNNILESQIRTLEKARITGNYVEASEIALGIKSENDSHDTDSSDGEGTTRRVKKLKINARSPYVGSPMPRPVKKAGHYLNEKKRARGRPKGKIRPLNEMQRRQRNADLERERRDIMTEAYAELRTALNRDQTTTRAQILAAACRYIDSRPDVQVVKLANRRLEQQIAKLEAELSEKGGNTEGVYT